MRQIFIVLFFTFVSLNASSGNLLDYQKHKVSDDIELLKISDNVYIHVSVAEIGGFGNVYSNGMVIIGADNAACLIDTPYEEKQTEVLYEWIRDNLGANILYFVPTHWHKDCMGGIDYLHSMGVKSYANKMTIDIAREHGLTLPQYGFKKAYKKNFAGVEIECFYPGSGHSLDNIVVWLPESKILFGGCLVKDINADDIGNVADGNVIEWPLSLRKVEKRYSDAKIIIPGHGKPGDMRLIDHTRRVCQDYQDISR